MKKRMRNKIWTLLLCLAVILCPLTAHADVIWEPEDSFWEDHWEECQYLGRSYRTVGGREVYKSPENSTVMKKLQDGEVFWSAYTYTDAKGNEWALYEDGKSGWIAKAQLEVVYDYISFAEEYKDAISRSSGQLDKKFLGTTIYLWNYPGALQGERHELKDFKGDLPEYDQTFEDEYGHTWGFVGYWYGYRNLWICLDEPASGLEALYGKEIPVRGVSENGDGVAVEKSIDPAEAEKVVPAEDGSNLLVNFVVTLLVAGVIIITIFILRKIKRGKQ